MALFVHGMGTATPPAAFSQDEAATMAERFGDAEQRRQLRALYRLTRVRQRHSVLFEPANGSGEPPQTFYPQPRDAADRGPSTRARMERYEHEAPPLAAQAARTALAGAGWQAGDITHLVTVSCTGFAAPNFDVGLIRALGLAWTVARTHVGFMGCHAALNGLRVAQGFADSQPVARVMVCAVELCSLHFQYGSNPDWLVANALFADGAAALVGCAQPPARADAWRLAASGAALLEDSAELMSWRIGDHGFEMSLSPRVPGVIERELRPYLDRWLGAHGLSVRDIASWALHPGGPRILEACAAATGIGRDDYAVSREVLAEYGNMSSPTILFILERLRRASAPRPCVALGFGPGLAVEAALWL
jgi:predicted naringenin-chalcone synthase